MMGKAKQRTAAALFCLLLGLLSCAAAQEPVFYLDEKGEKQSCTQYAGPSGKLEGGQWYVVSGTGKYDGRVEVVNSSPGNPARLILTDGSSWTIQKGIRLKKGQALTIYAQSEKEETMGKLIAHDDGTYRKDHAAIGGNHKENGGDLTICGGNIQAECQYNSMFSNAAGIGGGDSGDGGRVVIYGGIVKARGNGGAVGGGAGIGGGNEGNGGEVIIYGGTVEARGSNCAAGIGGGDNGSNGTTTIIGGTVRAVGGSCAAGIGGGDNGSNGTTTIIGGTVRAEGGKYGAGIGGGEKGDGGVITIHGGDVTAIGGDEAAGIGGGNQYGDGGTITITGGTVAAWCSKDYGAGIGGGDKGKGGTIKISGGTVTATGGKDAAGIGGGDGGDGGSIKISGGTVTAWCGKEDGAGIGGGNTGRGGTIEISGGTVTAMGTGHGAGIGSGDWGKGGSVKIKGGTVYATSKGDGAGIGGGEWGTGGSITISGGEVTATGDTGIGGGNGGEGAELHLAGGRVRATGRGVGVKVKGDGIAYDVDAGRIDVATDDGTLLDRLTGKGTSKKSHYDGKKSVRLIHVKKNESVSYLDQNGQKQKCSTYKLLEPGARQLEGGQWYAADGGLVYDQQLNVVNAPEGNPARLILVDGASMVAMQGIRVSGDNVLEIYAQTTDEKTVGWLRADSSENGAGQGYAGIGANDGEACGTIIINGGRVRAHGSHGAAGIGGGYGTDGGRVTIRGGHIIASGHSMSIGGGEGSLHNGSVQLLDHPGGFKVFGGGSVNGDKFRLIGSYNASDENRQSIFQPIKYAEIVAGERKPMVSLGDPIVAAPGVTAESVQKKDQSALVSGLTESFDACAALGGGEDSEALMTEINRLREALGVLTQAEQVERLILSLPEQPDEAEAQQLVRTAQEEYYALSAHGRSLVSGAAADKLERLIRQLGAQGGDDLPQTGDESHLMLWLALLALSAAGALIWRRRRA